MVPWCACTPSRAGSNACSSRSTPTACSTPQTGLLTRDCFFRDLSKAIAKRATAANRLSLARFSFEGASDERGALDRAQLMTRLIRNIDFATGEDDGAILVAFTQTDLRSAACGGAAHCRQSEEYGGRAGETA